MHLRHGYRDQRVVVQQHASRPPAAAWAASGAATATARAESGRNQAQRVGRLLLVRKMQALPRYWPMRSSADHSDHRPHIIEHQALDRHRQRQAPGWPASTMPIRPTMLVPTQSSVRTGACACTCASSASMSAAYSGTW